MSSSAFSLTLTLPASGFEVTTGEPAPGGLNRDRHQVCPECMTWMFTRTREMDLINLRPTMLDHHAWFEPFVDAYLAEALPWASTGAKRRFERFPDMNEYPALIAAHAREGARPVGRPGGRGV